jgi:hypothetical protein
MGTTTLNAGEMICRVSRRDGDRLALQLETSSDRRFEVIDVQRVTPEPRKVEQAGDSIREGLQV